MKKIIYFLVLLAGLGFIRCNNDDYNNPYAIKELNIIKAEVLYEAVGGTGVIEIQTDGTLSAVANQDWCSVIISGNTVTLNVAAHEGLESRNALLTINTGEESGIVTITQKGSLMWFDGFDIISRGIRFDAEGGTLSSAVKSSYTVDVVEKPDWLSYKFENDSVYLTVAASNTPRKGPITFKSMNREIIFDVSQVSFASFLGEWDVKYNNPSSGNREEITTATIVEKDKDLSFYLEGLIISGQENAKIEMQYIPTTSNVTISAGQHIATIGTNFVYLCLRSAAGKYTWVNSSQLLGQFSLSENNAVTFTFVDNGTWDGNIAGGFGFYIFNGQPPSNSTATGSSYRRLMNIVMTKK